MSKSPAKSPAGAGVIDLTFFEISQEDDLTNSLNEVIKGDTRAVSSCKALRLANNQIPSCELLIGPLLALQFDPTKILWLDLSFNSISSVTEILCSQFPNLTTLYLHANKISKLSDIRKLSGLEHLKSLTMYGNPVEESKHYKQMMLYAHPSIVQIDFCTITERQRQQNKSWGDIYRRKLHPEEDESGNGRY